MGKGEDDNSTLMKRTIHQEAITIAIFMQDSNFIKCELMSRNE